MSETGYSEEFSPSPNRDQEHTDNLATKSQNRKQNESQNDENLVSILTMDPMEQKRKINSPRSLEACRLEGVKAKELLYIPKELFQDPKLPDEVGKLRYEFNENKRQELIALVKKARKDIVKDHERTSTDQPTMAGSTMYNKGEGDNMLSQRSIQTSKSTRSKLSMKSTVLVGGAMDKDKEVTQKQMDLIKKIREKEQNRFEKYIVNEERKNRKLEEKESRFESLRKQEQQKENMIKKVLKEENEKKLKKEIKAERHEQVKEKKEKKKAWNTFMSNLDQQKKLETLEVKERKRKDEQRKLKEQKRLEQVKKCEKAKQRQIIENERKQQEMNRK